MVGDLPFPDQISAFVKCERDVSDEPDRRLGWWRSILWAGVMPLAMVATVLLVAVGVGIIPLHACITESKQKISDLSGLDFEISETDCDTLAKDASMSVVVAKHGDREKTLLFKFMPVYGVPLPNIAVDAQRSTILISVPEIEDIFSRQKRWRDLAIKDDIGTVHYPSSDATPDAK
jgi:hypothetical protein